MNSIKHFMVDKAWNQSNLAAALECTVSHVSLILSGKRDPSLDLIRRLHQVTRIPIDTLVREAGKTARRKEARR